MKKCWEIGFNYLLVLCVFVFMMVGCATMKPPALSSETNSIDVSKESIALLTVKISNQYKPSYQPDVKNVFIWSNGKGDKKKFSFSVDGKLNEVKNSYNEYLISFQLPPGEYKMRAILARSGFFPVIGTFVVPIYSPFILEPNKIIYLGHIEATVKERKDDKLLRAGPVIPLIDQAATGASGGTFDVTITDLFQDDIKLFQQKYPYLSQYNVDNRTLPNWTQPSKEDMQ